MLPTILQEGRLNQIDKSLSILEAPARIFLTASQSILDKDISATVLLSLVNELKGVRCEVQPSKTVPEKGLTSRYQSVITVTDYGETYLVDLDKQIDGALTFRSYFQIDEVWKPLNATGRS